MTNGDIPRRFWWVVLGFAACTSAATPTSMCGCPPARTAARIIGTLNTSAGAPERGVRVVLLNRSQSAAQGGFATAGQVGVETDSLGRFRATTYSGSSPGVHDVRAGFVRGGSLDTLWVAAGAVLFRAEAAVLDSLVVTVQLP